MMAFVGDCWVGGQSRRRVLVCKKKGGGGGGGMSTGTGAARRQGKTSGAGSKSIGRAAPATERLKRPVVSTEGLVEEIDLSATSAFSRDRNSLLARGGGFDNDEWVEWDRKVCGDWEDTKGTVEFINSLVPEVLHLDFPSFAEALKLVVVVVILFFFLAGFTYAVDGFYLSIARDFFGSAYFF